MLHKIFKGCLIGLMAVYSFQVYAEFQTYAEFQEDTNETEADYKEGARIFMTPRLMSVAEEGCKSSGGLYHVVDVKSYVIAPEDSDKPKIAIPGIEGKLFNRVGIKYTCHNNVCSINYPDVVKITSQCNNPPSKITKFAFREDLL